MKESVLITGASGFLGFHLINAALQANLDVFAAVRAKSNISHLSDLPIKIIHLEYENPLALAEDFKQKNTTTSFMLRVLQKPIVKQNMTWSIMFILEILRWLPAKFRNT